MCEFKDFRRNIPCFEEYDENSFIGKWYDDGVQDDEEYWKLENDLIEVRKKYPYPMDIPRYVVIGIGTIIDFLMVPNWKLFEIKASPWLPDSVGINERYERLKTMLRYIFTEKDIVNVQFDYYNKKQQNPTIKMPSETVFDFRRHFPHWRGGNLWKIDLKKSLRIFLVLPNLFPKQKMRFPTNPLVITIAGGNWKS